MSAQPLTTKDVICAEFQEILPQSEKFQNLGEAYAYVHTQSDQSALTGLCISGGGIRSATFGLGIMQGLARKGLLDQFHYLSTVSGGGYIGSWFKAWQKNDGGSFEGFLNPGKATPDPEAPEPEPLRHLRAYSNYLSPRLGLFSADAWSMVAIYLRNLILNWCVLVPLLVALVLLPRFGLAALQAMNGSAALWLLGAGTLVAWIAVASLPLFLPSLREKLDDGTPPRQVILLYVLPLLAADILITMGWKAGRAVLLSWSAALFPGWSQDAQIAAACIAATAVLFLPGLVVVSAIQLRPGGRETSWALVPGAVAVTLLGGMAFFALDKWFMQALVSSPVRYFTLAPPILLCSQLLGCTLMVGVASNLLGDLSARRGADLSDLDKEWWGRADGCLLMAAFGWLLVCGLVMWMPIGALGVVASYPSSSALLASIMAAVTGPGASIYAWSSKSAGPAGAPKNKASQLLEASTEKIAAPLFVVLLISGSSLLVSRVLPTGALQNAADQIRNLEGGNWWQLLAAIAVAVGVSAASGALFSTNRFSMMALYRNRLIRAYLGASRRRQADLWSGFDPKDNIAMADMPKTKPFHLLNLTLNLTSGKELAWQQRKAEPFSVSRLHVGSAALTPDGAYCPSANYTDGGGISLGTAVALSGAAASPNMGYHSSKALSLLMSLFNIRLGAWLPNPAKADEDLLKRTDPVFPYQSVAEAIGATDDDSKWVYLSDGGHFENLGLYELVRRRCRFIVVSDGSADPKYQFDDLSNAIHKIRVDLGIPIQFCEQPSLSKICANDALPQCAPASHCAWLWADYAAVDGRQAKPGMILYFKAGVCREMEQDVRLYHSQCPQFPQEGTGDQFFSESQFEAYRQLGQHSVEHALEGTDSEPLWQLMAAAQHRYAKPRVAGAASGSSGNG